MSSGRAEALRYVHGRAEALRYRKTLTIADTTRFTSATGIRTFQPSRINWSYRYRGSVARIQMNTYSTTNVFSRNQIQPGMYQRKCATATFENGGSHPPKNSVVMTADTTIMFAYSARKNIANRMPLYSVWKPPVSSCSASARSTGVRLVSAS